MGLSWRRIPFRSKGGLGMQSKNMVFDKKYLSRKTFDKEAQAEAQQPLDLDMRSMSQLYARVFLQILDSSIAEDFTLRHIFEDFLKLCDHKTGILDMTRQALSRRLNLPIATLDDAIVKLESPDPNSRDEEHEGRRIERLDEHRDWGWKILNWEKYEKIRTRADVYLRVSRHRDKQKEERVGFSKPGIEEVKLLFSKSGLPMSEAEKFFNYYESNGWRVGKNPMRSWTSAAANWKRNFEERKYETHIGNTGQRPRPDRNAGTLNAGRSKMYEGVGKVLPVPNVQ